MLEHTPRAAPGRRNSLTGLLLPLGDRSLLLPNVAVAELIGYQAGVTREDEPAWSLGRIIWRDLSIPLVSFEAASGGSTHVGERARIVVLNALGDSGIGFIALLVQGIPRSCKIDNQLNYVDVPLGPLELAAVQVGEQVPRVPDLIALEQLLLDEQLI
ncbi:chemotaxis protein CheW [Pseudomonas sp. R5(2019)]|uniref:chemotaxis protein CheW n=1 Tax=Pseudomonas sp. R5(2019) TaxID=2697566 RepID=UPI001412814C|nr:chemotaxis protein CheW [Pseudomonas sp. R5(2019)]NBA96637.1 chemotaxis protein CheW [Pseudomonas sp. R5(2019)]